MDTWKKGRREGKPNGIMLKIMKNIISHHQNQVQRMDRKITRSKLRK